MRKIFFGILLIFIIVDCQTVPIKEEEWLKLNQVNQVDLSKDMLFDKIHEWIARTYGSSKEVVELTNKSTGKIIGNAIRRRMHMGLVPVNLHYTFVIDVKDKKFRIIFENIFASGINQYGPWRRGKNTFFHEEFDEIRDEFDKMNLRLVEVCNSKAIKKDDF